MKPLLEKPTREFRVRRAKGRSYVSEDTITSAENDFIGYTRLLMEAKFFLFPHFVDNDLLNHDC